MRAPRKRQALVVRQRGSNSTARERTNAREPTPVRLQIVVQALLGVRPRHEFATSLVKLQGVHGFRRHLVGQYAVMQPRVGVAVCALRLAGSAVERSRVVRHGVVVPEAGLRGEAVADNIGPATVVSSCVAW